MAEITIAGRPIGPGHPSYIIAEVSANHGGGLAQAEQLVRAAADAGADAVKLQTYTADSLTLDSDAEIFRVGQGTLWTGRTLHDLYEEAHTPWEWHEQLFALARDLGVDMFSSPFDRAAVELLDRLDAPAMKIASFELVDLELISLAAATGRPLILSTGMATVEEIDEAVAAARRAEASGIVLLRCNSAYPASLDEMNLRTIPDMAQRWGVPIGFSDHTLGVTAAITAIALGACVIEKHITLSRNDPTADAAFSLEPDEFAAMVRAIRDAESSLGTPTYGPSEHEKASVAFRRSLFVVADIAAGEQFTSANVRSIRPSNGLAPKHLPEVLGRHAARALPRGTPLSWDVVAD
ncbi:MAG TPA: pseudaminic acid synthase [Acidimicrobiales bacterium]|nr:pseudaminic acid synthase [Acidimicrobiales bacterium]